VYCRSLVNGETIDCIKGRRLRNQKMRSSVAVAAPDSMPVVPLNPNAAAVCRTTSVSGNPPKPQIDRAKAGRQQDEQPAGWPRG
jgi:hypothetical protein